jgi:hypothetical protein
LACQLIGGGTTSDVGDHAPEILQEAELLLSRDVLVPEKEQMALVQELPKLGGAPTGSDTSMSVTSTPGAAGSGTVANIPPIEISPLLSHRGGRRCLPAASRFHATIIAVAFAHAGSSSALNANSESANSDPIFFMPNSFSHDVGGVSRRWVGGRRLAIRINRILMWQ